MCITVLTWTHVIHQCVAQEVVGGGQEMGKTEESGGKEKCTVGAVIWQLQRASVHSHTHIDTPTACQVVHTQTLSLTFLQKGQPWNSYSTSGLTGRLNSPTWGTGGGQKVN